MHTGLLNSRSSSLSALAPKRLGARRATQSTTTAQRVRVQQLCVRCVSTHALKALGRLWIDCGRTAVCLQQPRELRVAVRHVERRDARRIGAADRVAALIEVREGGNDVGECEEPRVDVDQLLQPITLRALKCTVASAKYELC